MSNQEGKLTRRRPHLINLSTSRPMHTPLHRRSMIPPRRRNQSRTRRRRTSRHTPMAIIILVDSLVIMPPIGIRRAIHPRCLGMHTRARVGRSAAARSVERMEARRRRHGKACHVRWWLRRGKKRSGRRGIEGMDGAVKRGARRVAVSW